MALMQGGCIVKQHNQAAHQGALLAAGSLLFEHMHHLIRACHKSGLLCTWPMHGQLNAGSSVLSLHELYAPHGE